MSERSVPTLFDWMGGMPVLERLFYTFFAKVPDDPLLAPVFANLTPEHVKHIAAFVAEVFGGPMTYTARYGGHSQMIQRHAGRALSEAQRARWVELLLQCADEIGISRDPEFRAAFVAYLEWGTREAAAVSQPGADLSRETPMPSWRWGQVKGPRSPG